MGKSLYVYDWIRGQDPNLSWCQDEGLGSVVRRNPELNENKYDVPTQYQCRVTTNKNGVLITVQKEVDKIVINRLESSHVSSSGS